jgi:hypothetical protein
MKGAGVQIAVEAHTGLKKRVTSLNAIADEGGELVTAFAVGNGEEVSQRVGEFFEAVFKIALPARAGVDAGLRLPVLFVLVEALGPVGGGCRSREGGNRRGRRRWDVGALEGQVGVGGKRGDRRWCDEIFDLLCSRRNH